MAADQHDPNEQCPSRGPALSHVQDGRVYEDGRCVICNTPLWIVGTKPDDPDVPDQEGVDIVKRMQDLGFFGAYLAARDGEPGEPEEADEDIRDDPYSHEPQMRVKEYEGVDPRDDHPTGPAWGWGRSWWGDGGLSFRDTLRLNAVLHRERKNGYR